MSLTLKDFKDFYNIHIVEIPTQKESTHENVQSCLSNEKREYATGFFLWLIKNNVHTSCEVYAFVTWKTLNLNYYSMALIKLSICSLVYHVSYITVLCNEYIVCASSMCRFQRKKQHIGSKSHFSGIVLPPFQFDYRLTGIDDNFASNYIKIQADFIFWNVRLYL